MTVEYSTLERDKQWRESGMNTSHAPQPYLLSDPAVSMKLVRFVTGADAGRIAKLASMDLGNKIVIDVVLFMDGHNGWNFQSEHIRRCDRVELLNGSLSEIEATAGTVPAKSRIRHFRNRWNASRQMVDEGKPVSFPPPTTQPQEVKRWTAYSRE